MKRFFCLLAVFASIQHNVHAQSRLQDSLALVDLYNSTNGANWRNHTNWLTTNPIEQWYGITIEQGRVKNLQLNSNQLAGTLPTSLGNLSNLVYLELMGNQLTGNIPTSVGQLSKVFTFNLSLNQLTGIIPSTLGNMSNVWSFILNNNNLTGAIPATLGRCSRMSSLRLDNNQLTGNIPDSLGQLAELYTLNFQNNRLTGSIPVTFGRLTKLSTLYLNDNQLSGNIPDSLGNALRLTQIFFENNQLTGNIPASLGQLRNLFQLRLYRNKLTGTIPQSLGRLQFLSSFLLSNNQLSGELPDSLGYAAGLISFDVSNNYLTGKIPATFQNLSLFRLDYYHNKLDSMPNLSGFSSTLTAGFKTDTNRLTFDDILPNISFRNLVYAPQDSIYKDTIFFKSSSDNLFIDLGIDAAITTNKYEWYKNGILFQTNMGSNKLIINRLQPNDNGIYTCKVTNVGAPLLTLNSRKIRLNVDCRFLQVAQQKQICENTSYTLSHGRQVNSAGIYQDTLNCDTVLVIQLSVIRKDTTRLSATTCNPTAVGIRDTILKNRFGCDSLVRTTFIHVPIVTRLRDSIVCLARDTQTRTRTERSFNGCDSFVVQTFRLARRDTTVATEIVCDTLNERLETSIVSNREGCQTTIVTRHVFDRCECLKGTILYNALIPNDNDAKNNYFMIQNLERYTPNELVITDKRNELVYQVTNYNNDWSGTNSKGEPLPEGVYNYLFRMTDPISKQVCKRIGVIHIQYIP